MAKPLKSRGHVRVLRSVYTQRERERVQREHERDRVGHWNHGAGIIRHKEDQSSVFVRAMSTYCLLCHTVHDSCQFQKSLILSCPLCGPFFSKLH